MQSDKYIFNYDQRTATAELEDIELGIKAITFESTPSTSVLAYLAARYSRSKLSIVETYNQLLNQNEEDASTEHSDKLSEDRLEKMFHGYGHASVGDQAQVIICLENVPQYLIEVIFNWVNVVAGQARSTRYQDFTSSDNSNLCVTIPTHLEIDKEWVEEYDSLMQQGITNFTKLLPLTEIAQGQQYGLTLDGTDNKSKVSSNHVRSLDTARYLLPMGLRSSVALFINARELSDLISQLQGSSNTYNNAVAALILNLLTNDDYVYKKQTSSLIRHAAARFGHYKTDELIYNLIKAEGLEPTFDHTKSITQSVLTYSESNFYSLFSHALQLYYPRILDLDLGTEDEPIVTRILKEISEVVFNTSHHDLPGPIVQTGAISIHGIMDIGAARDLNRHRSIRRWFPYLSDFYPTVKDLMEVNVSSKFTTCPYLDTPPLDKLKVIYEQTLSNYYYDVQSLILKGLELNINKDVLNEYLKYLLPMGHLVNYSVHLDIKSLLYIAHLRTAPGGHIAYRIIVDTWVQDLAEENDFFAPLLQALSTVDPESIQQYFCRD